MTGPGSILARLERLGRFVENGALVVLLGTMIVLAASQIILRNFFDTGFVWADEFLRLCLLWTAMFGAVAASRDNKQISIDVLSRFLKGRWNAAASLLVQAFTSGITAIIAWHSFRFVRDSRQFEDVLLGDWPAWIFQLVLPLAFALIAYRYLLFAMASTIRLLRGEANT